MVRYPLVSLVIFVSIALCGWSICFIKYKKNIELGNEARLANILPLLGKSADLILFGDSVITSNDYKATLKGRNHLRLESSDSVCHLLSIDLNASVFDGSILSATPEYFYMGLDLLAKDIEIPFRVLVLEINPVTINQAYPLNKPYDIESARYKMIGSWFRFFRYYPEYLYELHATSDATESEKESLLIKKQQQLGYALMKAMSDNNVLENLRLYQTDQPMDLLRLQEMLTLFSEKAHKIATHVMFFVTPVDISGIKALKGTIFIREIENRVKNTLKFAQELNIPCLDLHNLISDTRHFQDGHRVHLDDEGKAILARTLAQYIQEQGWLNN